MSSFVSLSAPRELSTNWLRLIAEAGEVLSASAQVVTIRVARIARAGPLPDERDRAEFSLMGTEKAEAMCESLQAIVSSCLDLGMTSAAEAGRQVWATSAAATDLAASQSPTQWLGHQTAFLEIAAAAVTNPFQFACSMARVVQDGLAPIHRRVTANVGRLEAL